MIAVNRVLISVSRKEGIVEFARELQNMGVEIISTGGTAKVLQDSGIKIISVADYTGFPEMLDGRVKTLHPKIHGGLLGIRDNEEHVSQMKEHDIQSIEMVVVNLYPFQETQLKKGATHDEIIENIDIGGPAMLRSASKNYKHCVALCDPDDYFDIIDEMKKNNGMLSNETSGRLAAKVFAHTAEYERAIAHYFREKQEGLFPEYYELSLKKVSQLRYGENPHQQAALYKFGYVDNKSANIVQAKQLHGKQLSFNNIMDMQANLSLVMEFDMPAAVIMKHTNPCGVAEDSVLSRTYSNAHECDPVSAFGSIVGFNREVCEDTAKEIQKTFVECVLAPKFSLEALKILTAKKNVRLIEIPGILSKESPVKDFDIKPVSGGFLVQEKDNQLVNGELKVVTQKNPTDEEIKAMEFAWKVVKHVKSNAIVLATKNRTIAIGAGQMSRVDSTKIAIMKMQSHPELIVMASDAFFPFRDCIDEAVKENISAVIQPGGSIRDKEVIDACDEHGIAMVFTGMRHFKH